MGTAIEIRKCLAADIARTGQFYNGVILWLNGHVNYPRWIYRVYPSEASVRAMTETGTQYVCLSGDVMLGAFVLNAEAPDRYRNGRWRRALPEDSYRVIHALAVDPRIHRQGIASEIIRFCVRKAKSDGCQALRADIVPTNLPAKRLFEKNGFTYAGDVEPEPDIAHIPAFSLYEMNW